MISLNVPGYEVDSLITKVSLETNGAISDAALRSNASSGSRSSLRGVGTQIAITDASETED